MGMRPFRGSFVCRGDGRYATKEGKMGRFAYIAGFVAESAWGILPEFMSSVSLGVRPPPEQKAALYPTENEDMTQKDLAGGLGISVSGARSRVQRARTRLGALLLDCCLFELDRRGIVINYYDRERAPNRPPPTPQAPVAHKNTGFDVTQPCT